MCMQQCSDWTGKYLLELEYFDHIFYIELEIIVVCAAVAIAPPFLKQYLPVS